MTQHVIGIDLDDVIMDTNTALCGFHNEQFGTELTRDDIFTFFIDHVWGCSRSEAYRRIHAFMCSTHHDATPLMPGTRAALESLASHHLLHVITSRPEEVKEQTMRWINQWVPEVAHSVHFTSDFDAAKRRPKSEVCRDLAIDVFIDDAPHHVTDIASAVDTVFLMDAPWNRGVDALPENVERVNSWDEIMQRL